MTLSILLLVVGTAATLAAFGGRTWEEGDDAILKRITPRGWVSLACLVLALFVGSLKEVHEASDQAKTDADRELAAAKAEQKETEMQGDLKAAQDQIELLNTRLALADTRLQLANTNLDALKKQANTTQDQITGGRGFPVVTILTQFPDNGSFPLWAIPHGDAPLSDVSYKVIEGPAKTPTPEDLKQLEAFLTGNASDQMHFIGELVPRRMIRLDYAIHPSQVGISTYRIVLDARNGMVEETLEVRFNGSLSIWQFRYEITNQDPRFPSKLLVKEDWQPQRPWHMLYGEGPPHN
jgi:hypothetical protein